MLINLSNHPSEYWSEAQTGAAHMKWGRIVDVPFPAIAPTLIADEVRDIATEYCSRCVELLGSAEGEPCAVHLMGEMTFCCYLVAMLKSQGVVVVASAAEREVYYIDDVKNSIFNFVCFREY